MKSIKQNLVKEIVIKNSRFITYLYRVTEIGEVDGYLQDVKKKSPEATHYCYAYVIDNLKKGNDDGEPSGTAGIPMLQVLEKQNLNYILVIVVRYFGGIKLGAGGLVRAYTKAVTTVLEDNIIFLTKGYLVSLSFAYDKIKEVDYLLKKDIIIDKDYQDLVTYNLWVKDMDLDNLRQYSFLDIKILKEGWME